MTTVTEQPIDPDTTPRGNGAADRPRTRRREDSAAQEALSVDTVVVEERGRWAVDIVVVFADGIVRKRADTHPTKARAEISARLIRRAAERDIRGPLNG
ncbi:hypothetical protein BN1232_05824 [Mycobacterium lentiflavum]|uniref:Uncharacterized protein n=1 Tax=Mycobacterium lentiflavum TaxID=141349 RepID=A0A0E4CR06_MYCLN|nr:hypothetical protein [Mycobacterium lentiflavum]CQD23003.1 hypothetical protein BN1232_05824 [Mycobacterium lentiflavum]